MYSFLKKLVNLPRNIKIIFQFIIDTFLIIFAYYLSLFIRYESNYFFNIEKIFDPLIIFIPIAFFYLFFNRFYSYWLRYASFDIAIKISYLSIFTFLYMIIMDEIFKYPLLKSVSVLFSVFIFILLLTNKFFIKMLFIIANSNLKESSMIFGINEENLNYLYNFRYSKYKVVGFINPGLEKISNLSGHRAVQIEQLNEFIKKSNIKNILCNSKNLPNIKFIEKLSQSGVSIVKFDDNFGVNNNFELNKVSLDDLIGRFEVSKNYFQDVKFLKDKVVLITGAGGSIGSALFQELISHLPKKILCIDHNEYAIYKLSKKNETHQVAKFYLGNIVDKSFLEEIFESNKINVVFHCAAYKHVNITEQNQTQTAKNNILGTLNLVKLSSKFNIEKFTLISTDKAVKPSSVMGYTKYISEQICLREFEINNKTQFNVVRFGNVIGSSGSVIPLFNELIRENRAIEITDRKVERFFMSIREAVTLIISATNMDNSGRIYILDMGKPIKILDIAKKMILLSGKKYKVNNKLNKIDDNSSDIINIYFTGLKKGEKITEELSDSKLKPTENPKIFIASNRKYKLSKFNYLIKNFSINV